MGPKISVIIPVYNAGKTLHRCVDSILVQTFSDFEVLLIDDGCKDNSGNICDEYAKKDSRVKVVHKDNGGVSSARNVGLNKAKGEWITFIDADDYIASDFFSVIDNNDCDFIIGQSQHFDPSGKYWYSERLSTQKVLSEEAKRGFLEHNLLWHIMRTPWGKFFKRDLIALIRFDEGMKVGEDTVFVLVKGFTVLLFLTKIFNAVVLVYEIPAIKFSSKLSIYSIKESVNLFTCVIFSITLS